MVWNGEKRAKELEQALETQDLEASNRIIDEYLQYLDEYREIGDLKTAKRFIRTLRNYLKQESLIQIAEKISEFSDSDPHVQLIHANALVDTGQITNGISILRIREKELNEEHEQLVEQGIEADLIYRDAVEAELLEIRGLLGRAYKQLYIDANPNAEEPRTYDLEMAMNYYGRTFADNRESYWHGLNYIACRAHAESIRSPKTKSLDDNVKKISKIIYDTVKERDGPWAHATKAEIAIALRNNREAIESVKSFVEHPETTRFMINSTLRQFREIWNLTEDEPPGKQILPMMQAKLMVEGGRMELPVKSCNHAELDRLEKVYGDTGYQHIEWMKTALLRSQCVARIGKGIYEGDGTGFLFDGSLIHSSFANRHFVLTNAHVCTNDKKIREYLYNTFRMTVLSPEEAVVAFLGVDQTYGGGTPIRVKELLFTSPPQQVADAVKGQKYRHSLDATLLEIESVPDNLIHYPVNKNSITKEDRVNIIGHPFGRAMSISIQDNRVVETDDKHLWYRAPTDPGSSGSPIFDQAWNLVGLHHSSDNSRKANEGLRISNIIDALKKALAPKARKKRSPK